MERRLRLQACSACGTLKLQVCCVCVTFGCAVRDWVVTSQTQTIPHEKRRSVDDVFHTSCRAVVSMLYDHWSLHSMMVIFWST